MDGTKVWWTSKTIWMNLIALVGSILIAIGFDPGRWAEISTVSLAVVNLILRLSREPITRYGCLGLAQGKTQIAGSEKARSVGVAISPVKWTSQTFAARTSCNVSICRYVLFLGSGYQTRQDPRSHRYADNCAVWDSCEKFNRSPGEHSVHTLSGSQPCADILPGAT
jgi:hypothetical protein